MILKPWDQGLAQSSHAIGIPCGTSTEVGIPVGADPEGLIGE